MNPSLPPPYDLTESFASLGRQIYAKVTSHIADGEGNEEHEEIMEMASRLGLAKQELYDPEVHGPIEAEPGVDLIWTWKHLPPGWKTGFPAARFLDPATGQDQPNLSQRGVLVMTTEAESPASGSQFLAGDFVHHGPSGEDWVLACDEEKGEVMPLGWPMCIAKASDCTLQKQATPEQRLKILNIWAAPHPDPEGEREQRTITARRQLSTANERGEA